MQMEFTCQRHYFHDCLYDEYQTVSDDVLAMNCVDYQDKQKNFCGKITTESAIIENKTSVEDIYSTSPTNNTLCSDKRLETTKTTNVYRKSKPSLNTCNKQTKLKCGKSCYKHIPHKEKPQHVVERRNARERRRVQAVNFAFARLRKSVPLENRNKRVSKVKTLQKAIEYINYLQDILNSGHGQSNI